MNDSPIPREILDAGMLETPADPIQRIKVFVSQYLAAPNSADITVRIATDEHGKPAVVIGIDDALHGFSAIEARKLADFAESAMRALPNHPDAVGMPNLIMALRHGADAAEAARKE